MTAQLWLQENEFAELEGWTARHVRRLATDGEVRTKLAEQPGRNGKRARLYAATSLTADAQKRLLKRNLTEAGASEALVLASPQQPALFTNAFDAPRVLANKEDEAVAMSRYDIIKRLLDWDKGMRPSACFPNGSPIGTKDQLAQFLSQQHEISVRTLWGWHGRFKQHGFAGLANNTRKDKGRSRFLTTFPKAESFVRAKYIVERLSVAAAYEALRREWPQLYPATDPPSYSTICKYLNSLPLALTVVGREGEKQWNSKIEPYLRRDFEAIQVNEWWVSDHRIFDVFCFNDDVFSTRRYQAMRIWHTMIIDMRSRKIVGWAFCDNPSSESISSALRMAMSQYGVPKNFYIDNGKDYKKIGKHVELEPGASGLLDRLGVAVTYCLPKHPQSKLVESFFSGQSKRFDKLFMDAYAGNKPANRPDACQALLEQHKRWVRGDIQYTPLEPASNFILYAEQWFEEYNNHLHTGDGMRGRTPNQVFDAQLPPEMITHLDMAQLAPLFWDRETRTALRGGTVERYGQTYEPIDPDSKRGMWEAIGHKVMVACDPNDIAFALAFNMDGEFLARLQAQQLVAQGPVSREAIRSSLRERRAMLRAIKSYIAAMEKVPTELDYMRQRAGVDVSPRLIPPPKALPTAGAVLNGTASVERLQPEDIAEQALLLEEN